ncbi:hypothetical protein ACFWCB_20945 [Streptomyces sp. NPDC060048]
MADVAEEAGDEEEAGAEAGTGADGAGARRQRCCAATPPGSAGPA